MGETWPKPGGQVSAKLNAAPEHLRNLVAWAGADIALISLWHCYQRATSSNMGYLDKIERLEAELRGKKQAEGR